MSFPILRISSMKLNASGAGSGFLPFFVIWSALVDAVGDESGDDADYDESKHLLDLNFTRELSPILDGHDAKYAAMVFAVTF